jgi:hypothetical protein
MVHDSNLKFNTCKLKKRNKGQNKYNLVNHRIITSAWNKGNEMAISFNWAQEWFRRPTHGYLVDIVMTLSSFGPEKTKQQTFFCKNNTSSNQLLSGIKTRWNTAYQV